MRSLSFALLALLVACDDSPADSPAPDASPLDAAVALDQAVDQAVDDAAVVDAALPDAEVDAAPPGPTDYCEASVDAFCPFYLRCGRMAVDDLESCRAAFLSNCNAVYEPVYAALAEADLLALDPAGIEACAAHLETVTCEAHIFDLDGPCGTIWRGLQPAGGACAPGIESFVCAPGTTCVLGLNFCGTCEAVTPLDGDCSEQRCGPEARCVDGRCLARALPGEPCGDPGCVLGSRCVDGTCAGPARAALGEPCDRTRGCPYKSACVGGTCVEAALVGESCAGRPCAGGTCVDGTCVAPAGPGDACTQPAGCVGQACADGTCGSIPGACFAR